MTQTGGSNLPTRTGTVNNLGELLKQHKDQFAMVLPKILTVDKLIRTVISTVTLNPKLIECDQKSFMRSVLQAASLGLEPGGPLGQAHLVPFWNSSKHQLDCQLIIDYKGYIALAHRSKEVGRISAKIVFNKEPWHFSENDIIVHTPLPPSERGEKKVMAYAKAFDRAGVLIAQEYLWAEEVEAIKKKSLDGKKNAGANPWNLYEEAMWRKSPVRKLAKWMPMSPEMQKAAIMEEYQEEGITPTVDVDLSFAEDNPPASDAEQKTQEKADQLKDKLRLAQDQAGAPAGQVPEPVVEGAEATAGPQPPGADAPADVVDAEYEFPPMDPPPTDEGNAPPNQEIAGSPPIGAGEPPPPPEPERSSVFPPPPRVRNVKGPETIGPSKGPRIESGKKAESYWLNENQIKCPPGGEKAGLITTKAWCDGHCQYRRRCFVFKD